MAAGVSSCARMTSKWEFCIHADMEDSRRDSWFEIFWRKDMRRVLLTVAAIAVGVAIGIVLAKRLAPVQAQAKPGFGFAAVPGEKGGQDITGPYEVVPDWPKPLTSLP